MKQQETLCCLGLGANLGSKQKNLDSAVELIGAIDGVELIACSRWYETAPVGGPAGQPDFLNGACVVRTTLSALTLLEHLLGIEKKLGRGRSTEVRWGPRPIDIDILLFGESVIDLPDLQVPHPRMHQRRFVLEPLAEIAPQARHPVLRLTVDGLLKKLMSDENGQASCI